ncbi:MAG: hypothetical protein ABIN01_19795 [Ferruginibacter sp.]
MLKLILILSLLSAQVFSYCQSPDFISVRRKNGQIIKTIGSGSSILFETKEGYYINGRVKEIKNDSIFVTTYDIRTVPTYLGVTKVDTFGTYLNKVNYRDIKRIKVFKRPRFIRGKIDKLLMYGGAGYVGLNILNALYLKQPVTEKGNLKSLGIAVGAVGVGFIIKKYFYVNRFSRRWHNIVYVKMS